MWLMLSCQFLASSSTKSWPLGTSVPYPCLFEGTWQVQPSVWWHTCRVRCQMLSEVQLGRVLPRCMWSHTTWSTGAMWQDDYDFMLCWCRPCRLPCYVTFAYRCPDYAESGSNPVVFEETEYHWDLNIWKQQVHCTEGSNWNGWGLVLQVTYDGHQSGSKHRRDSIEWD